MNLKSGHARDNESISGDDPFLENEWADVHLGQVVTVTEVISPWNKRSPGMEAYRAK